MFVLAAVLIQSCPTLTPAAWTAENNFPGAYFGLSAGAADVNGDGRDDLIIGAPAGSQSSSNPGRAYVYLAAAGTLAATPAWTASGTLSQDRFGVSVASAGDVNGDGFDDVIVGASGYHLYQGEAYCYYGSITGSSSSADWIETGAFDNVYFGASVCGAGDVNADGFDDVIVGAPGFNGNSFRGAAYLFLGSPNGLSTTAAWTRLGSASGEQFGGVVAGAGDVNGDGFDDVLVAATLASQPEPAEGRVDLFLGSASGLSVNAAWSVDGGQDFARLGGSMTRAGDVNGDGFDDVIVGAIGFSATAQYGGRALLYTGSASGLSATHAWLVNGAQDSEYLGIVAAAGDVDRDGFDDVWVSSLSFDVAQGNEGRMRLFCGSATGLSIAPLVTLDGSQPSAYFG